jgi:hypothetical protein
LKANVPFLHVFVESHPVYGQTRETDPVFSWPVFSWLYG